MGPPKRLLQLGLLASLGAWLYSVWTARKSEDALTVEQVMLQSWTSLIHLPPIQFRKIVVGINCNVDMVVSGTGLLSKLMVKASEQSRDLESLASLDDLEAAFAHFFARGAAAERFISDEKTFQQALVVLENQLRYQTQSWIGGNAALMAQRLVATNLRAKVLLVGPIGPRLKVLLHPSIITLNSTKISKDELHIVMEYKAGEIWGDSVAPSNNRFIVSHDQFSASSLSIDIFFNTIAVQRPDLVVLSGLHLMQYQEKDLWEEKLLLLRRQLGQLSPSLPVHLELGSMAEKDFVRNLLYRIIPSVDSLGLNEQELTMVSAVGGGPNVTASHGATHVWKAVEMLDWLMKKFGRGDGSGRGLARIHFHCLTYHLIVASGSDWSNLQAALSAGVVVAGRQACGLPDDGDPHAFADEMELRTADSLLLDKELGKIYELNAHSPLSSWMRDDLVFLFSPTLVCKQPVRTVGLGDAISSTGLAYSQFYRYSA